MNASLADKMADDLFYNFRESSRQRLETSGPTLTLKESIVLNGNHFIPAGTKIQIIKPESN